MGAIRIVGQAFVKGVRRNVFKSFYRSLKWNFQNTIVTKLTYNPPSAHDSRKIVSTLNYTTISYVND